MTQSKPPTFDYLLMLRGVCALVVVMRHYPFDFARVPGLAGIEWLLRPFGYVPVLLFFCLSGFLITQGFVQRRYDVRRMRELLHYYRNRALRVLPLYYLSIAFCLLVFWPRPLDRLPEVASLLWFSGAYKVLGEVVFNHVYWTLPIEVAFFLLAPLVFLLCEAGFRRFGPLPSFLLVLAGYGVLSFALFAGYPYEEGALMSRLEWNRVAHLDLLYNFEAFLLGALAAVQVHQAKPLGAAARRVLMVGVALLLIAILMRTGIVGDRLFEQGKVDPFTLYLLQPLIGLWFLGFALLYARPQQCAFHGFRVAWRRALEALGHWSYGIYLLHMPMIALVERVGGSALSGIGMSEVALLGVLLASALAYRLVERPLMMFRAPPARRARGELDSLAAGLRDEVGRFR